MGVFAGAIGCREVNDVEALRGQHFLWHNDDRPEAAENVCRGPSFMYPIPGGRIPPGSGFRVAGRTGVKFLSFCVHYHGHEKMMTGGAEVGVQFTVTQQTTMLFSVAREGANFGLRAAGILWLEKRSGSLKHDAVSSVSVSMPITDPIVVHPLAVLIHMHDRGIGAKVWSTDVTGGQQKITSVKSHDRIDFVAGVLDSDKLLIHQNKTLTLQCTFNNTSPRDVLIG